MRADLRMRVEPFKRLDGRFAIRGRMLFCLALIGAIDAGGARVGPARRVSGSNPVSAGDSGRVSPVRQANRTPTPTPSWEKEPDGFRGIRWGTSEEQTLARIVFSRGCSAIRPGLRACTSDYGLGAVSTINIFGFSEDGFVISVLIYQSKDFPALRDIFVGSYGAPTLVAHEPVKIRWDFELQNEKLVWSGKVVTLELAKYFNTLEEGRASFTVNAYAKKSAGGFDSPAPKLSKE